MPLKLLLSYFVLFAHRKQSKKGITKFITPIDANQNQSLVKASILIFLYKQRKITGIAPKKILKNAIDTGP